MKKLLLLICTIFLSSAVCLAGAISSYDKYGTKTGSYKETSSGYTTYDKYGQKTGSYKTDSSGRITEYDKYGQKVGSYK